MEEGEKEGFVQGKGQDYQRMEKEAWRCLVCVRGTEAGSSRPAPSVSKLRRDGLTDCGDDDAARAEAELLVDKLASQGHVGKIEKLHAYGGAGERTTVK